MNNRIDPSAPTGTSTRFGLICPARRLRLLVVGHAPPTGVSGTTDTNVGWLPERLFTPVTLTSAPTTDVRVGHDVGDGRVERVGAADRHGDDFAGP